MEKSTGSSFELAPDSDAPGCDPSSKGNPATNEWIPSVDTVRLIEGSLVLLVIAGHIFFIKKNYF